ncbi:MAG TPA: sugar transferase [Lacipirellulaceae bacterium]|nr:sugar transferase [Lacipirellulaceae bacterium]
MRNLSPTSRSLWKVHFSIWDASWLLASPALALYLRDADIVSRADWRVIGSYWVAAAIFSLVGIAIFRASDEVVYHLSVHEMLNVVKAAVFAQLTTCVALFLLTRLDGIPRSTFVIHGLLLSAGLLARRAVLGIWHSTTPTEERSDTGHTIVIGANRFASIFIRLLNAYSPRQPRVIAVLDQSPAAIGRSIAGARIVGLPQHLGAVIDEFVVHGVHTDQVIIAGEADLLSRDVMRQVQRACDDRRIELAFLPRMISVRGSTEPVVPVTNTPLALPSFFWLKRLIDAIASLALVVLLSPLLVVIALLILADLGAPILFWQKRLGQNGRSFHIYKFRTLKPPFDIHGNSIPESTRLSAVGRLLRVTRADELPQLFNVLKGDMALIGPRPLLPEDQPSNTEVRLLVRPGITGWAQVNGGKLVSREEKQKLDEWYIRNASWRLDLQIIIRTLHILLTSDGLSAEALADVEQAQSNRMTNWSGAKSPAVSSVDALSSVGKTPSVQTHLGPSFLNPGNSES